MEANERYAAAETQTIQVLNETLENIKGWENEIANPPDDGAWTPKLTPQGFQMVKGPGEGEGARVDRLENNIYEAKAQALSTIQKNNAELPEAEQQQLQKGSMVVLYSDKRSLELASDKNASQPRSLALSQERDMVLKAQEYKQEMTVSNETSPGFRMSFPEFFPDKGPELSLEHLDIREIDFKDNAHQITTRQAPAAIEGPEAQAQIGAPVDIAPLELPSGSIDDMFRLNAPDITEPEPQLPGEDD